jgi:hypothetical protein
LNNRVDKKEIRNFLAGRDFDSLIKWVSSVRNPHRLLLSLAYDTDELIRWRAVETIGRVAKLQSAKDIAKVRDLIRRLLWLMNDESGGLSRTAPETIGEILVNVPSLIDEFGELLLAFLHEEPFETSAHLAIYRIASVDPKPFMKHYETLINSLSNPEPKIRAYSILALNKITPVKSRAHAKEKIEDETSLTIYDFNSGAMIKTTIKNIVQEILSDYGGSTHTAWAIARL